MQFPVAPISPDMARFWSSRLILAALTPALMLAGCTEPGQATDAGSNAGTAQASDTGATQTEAPATEAPAGAASTPQTPATLLTAEELKEMSPPLTDAMLESADGPPAPVDGGFDVHSLPLSAATLGAFPYITLPAGFSSQGFGKINKASARFPFWANNMEFWVDGRFYGTTFKTLPDAEYSLEGEFAERVRRLGGAEVGNGKIPPSVTKSWPDSITVGFVDGLGDVYNNPVKTWLIRHVSGNIWIQLVSNSAGGSYIIAHEKPHGTGRAQPAVEKQ